MAGPISNSRGREPQRAAQRPPQGVDVSFLYEDDAMGVFQNLDASRIPDGMSYKGLRLSTVGKADARSHARGQRNKWTPVPKKRHPEIVGTAEAERDPEGAIIEDGLMLVERPSFYTAKAEEIRDHRARERVRNQVRSLRITPEGQLPRTAAKAKRKFDIQVAEPDETEQPGSSDED